MTKEITYNFPIMIYVEDGEDEQEVLQATLNIIMDDGGWDEETLYVSDNWNRADEREVKNVSIQL